MRPFHAMFSLFMIAAIVLGSPSDDMGNLKENCVVTAQTITESLNGTMMLNTSKLVMNIVYQVGASEANLGARIATTATARENSTSAALDPDYFNYVDEIGTLCEAVQRRGRLFHQEMNVDVYNALQGLDTAVQAYGRRLRELQLISQKAIIRTFTAGGYIIDAQSGWANNVNYPGKAKMKRAAFFG